MNAAPVRPTLSASESAAMLAHLQQVNPQMYARLQAMRPDMMETANQHLAASAAESSRGHGHSHTHSSSCKHAQLPTHMSQPAPEPPPIMATGDMGIVQAVQYNAIDRVKELIESGQASAETPDVEGCYLLHWASINNHVEIVRYLIAKGAPVDVKGGDLRSSALHWACRQGCTESFFILVDNGATLDSTDNNGVQPIHIAAQYGQIKILAFLLGSGIDVECHDGRGFSPLIYACLGPPPTYSPLPDSTHVNCTQFLLTFGSDVNYQEPTRRFTPLHFAINSMNSISMHVLLHCPRINVQLKNVDNCDPLTFAQLRNNADAVATMDERVKSSKLHVQPKFLQRFVTNEHVRKWTTRFFMFMVMTIVGLSFNAYPYPYWLRLVVPVGSIFLLMHLFNYLVFDDHTKENFAYSYVLSSVVLMYVTNILYIQDHQWTLLQIAYHLLTIYGLFCVRSIKKVNPGFLNQQTVMMDGNSLTREKMCIAFARDPRWTLDHFCVTCLIRRPLRSKHCPVDGTCVAKFDHHCAWLDACIGARNHFYFIRVLTCGTLALVIWMHHAFEMFLNDNLQFNWKYLLTEVYDPWLIYIFVLSSFNTFWVSSMTSFHLYNSIVTGVTLNERMTRFRYSYFRDPNTGKAVNPFKNQLLKNFLETFGLFRLMAFCRYTRVDWSQIYDISQISEMKIN